MNQLRIGLVAILLGMGAAARAADPDPATPQGAQRLVRMAEEKGDKAEVRKYLHATNATEEKLADALAETTVVGAAAYKAAVDKFGEAETRKTLMGIVPIHPSAEVEAKTEWKVDGNKAKPIGPDKKEVPGPGLTKVDGVWKLAMSDITAGQPREQMDLAIMMLQKQAQVMRQYADETTQGKYASATDLRKAALERMNAMRDELMKEASTQSSKSGDKSKGK
jgi:hypothetical protein